MKEIFLSETTRPRVLVFGIYATVVTWAYIKSTFSDMVMLHIKFKGMEHTITC